MMESKLGGSYDSFPRGFCSCPSSRSGFFFQAEDGIRDHRVTGVQTCALPISNSNATTNGGTPSGDSSTPKAQTSDSGSSSVEVAAAISVSVVHASSLAILPDHRHRSEERRVGKEGRSRARTDQDAQTRGEGPQ